jgi:hypothetical protein
MHWWFRSINLGKYQAPIADGGFSLLGVVFSKAAVHRIHKAYGALVVGPDEDASADGRDNFIYSEP